MLDKLDFGEEMYKYLIYLLSLSNISFAAIPVIDIAREAVDLVELNHFYDEQGRLVFDQIIFYDWSSNDARYNVRAWRLIKNPSQLPIRDWELNAYVCFWQDGEQYRKLICQSFRETWTQYDPELLEREYLPKERRKELKTFRITRPRSSKPVVVDIYSDCGT